MKRMNYFIVMMAALASALPAQVPPTFTSPAPAPNSGFGTTVVASGNNVLIGAPGENVVYLFDGSERFVLRAFTISAGDVGALFGNAIAVVDSTVFIGAPLSNAGATDAGAVFVFNLNNGAALDTLLKPTPALNDSFGFSLAIAGDNLIVGAPRDDEVGVNAGAVHVFRLADRSFDQTLEHPQNDPSGLFGYAVAAFGDDFIVGAYSTGIFRSDAGAVYYYDGASLSVLYTFHGSDYGSTTLGFGFALGATSRDLIIGTLSQEVYLIAPSGVERRRYTKPAVSGGDYFGRAVAGAGQRILVSAADAYAFLFDSTATSARDTFSTAAARSDLFGSAVAFFGSDEVLVGEPGANNNSGAVYPFEVQQPITCRLEITSPQSGFRVQHDSILVTGNVIASEAGSISLCTVNGIAASTRGNQFSAVVPLPAPGKNILSVQSIFIGVSNDTAFCSDSLSVFRIDTLDCKVTIVSPDSGADVFGDSVKACLTTTVSGGLNPVLLRGTVNGRLVDLNNPACAQVPVSLGTQTLLAETIHLDNAASDSFCININTLAPISDVPQIVHQGVEFNAGLDANGATIPLSVRDTDQNDAVEIFVGSSSTFGAYADIVFPAESFGPGPTQVWITARTTGPDLSFQAFDAFGTPLAMVEDTVRGGVLQSFQLGGDAIRRIEIVGSEISVSEVCYTGAVKTDTVTCRDSITVNVFPIIRDVVFNEVSFDPNYDDLGTERIELKNFGSDTARFDNWALVAMRDTLVTAWKFHRNTKLAPGGLLVVHWLAEGTDDAGNVFTGLPSIASPDSFFGNNSTIASSMTLGGVGNDNSDPFVLELIQLGSAVVGSDPEFGVSAPTLVDFIQIGNVVAGAEGLAVQAGLWRSGDYLSTANGEGFSYELLAQPTDPVLSSSSDYFAQASPSLGFANKLVAPEQQHLLISEICVRPGFGEFIEIYNPGPAAVSLKDYYLTDNVTMRNNAYTLLTQGMDALRIDASDFFVRFPALATIPADSYQTVAFNTEKFKDWFGVSPTYEMIDDDDDPSNDMRRVKPDTTAPFESPSLADANEAVILLHWDGSSDLVEDVDYIVWGDTSVVASAQARREEAQANGQAGVTIFAGPLNEAVNKTGLGIDGADNDSVKSYYDNEADFKQQRPVGKKTHEFLKSWQRRPSPREFGERTAGGNGITGHDETSENLLRAFTESVPTPGERTKELDLEFDFAFVLDTLAGGNRDGILHRGEKTHLRLRLRNVDTLGTGPLISILRSETPDVTVGPDSVALFDNIAPGATELSLDFYDLVAKDESLPVIANLTLLVIDKDGGSVVVARVPIQILTSIKVHSIFFTVSATPTDTTVSAFFKLRNEAEDDATDLNVKLNLSGIGISAATNITFIGRNNGVTSFLTQQLRVHSNLDPALDVLNSGQLSGCLKLSSSEICRLVNCDHQNAYPPIAFNLPRVAVSFEYFQTRKVVPGMTVNLIETNAPPGMEPATFTAVTDTFGRVEFPDSLFEPSKSYRITVNPSNNTDATSLRRGIDFRDIRICDLLLTPVTMFSEQQADAIRQVGDVDEANGFTPADVERLDIFDKELPSNHAGMIGNTGQWRFGAPTIIDLAPEFSGRKFFTFRVYRLGDVNTDWSYPNNAFGEGLFIKPVIGQLPAASCSNTPIDID